MKQIKVIRHQSDKKFIFVYRSKCGHYYTQIKTFTNNGTLLPLTSKHRVTIKWLQENYPSHFKRRRNNNV